jgi:hypothetical protein
MIKPANIFVHLLSDLPFYRSANLGSYYEARFTFAVRASAKANKMLVEKPI